MNLFSSSSHKNKLQKSTRKVKAERTTQKVCIEHKFLIVYEFGIYKNKNKIKIKKCCKVVKIYDQKIKLLCVLFFSSLHSHS